jgi:hypothetical protein
MLCIPKRCDILGNIKDVLAKALNWVIWRQPLLMLAQLLRLLQPQLRMMADNDKFP